MFSITFLPSSILQVFPFYSPLASDRPLLHTHLQLSRPKFAYLLFPYQGTRDVRLDPQLNKKVWECGIKGVPHRLRVRISRKRNDEEDAKEKLYSYVQAVNVKNPKGLQTVVVEDA